MKKFKYRLERVLGYRQSVRLEKRRVLLIKQRALDEAQEQLAYLRREQAENGVAPDAVLSAPQLQLVESYGTRLRSEIAAQIETVARCETEVEAAREEYVEASKDAEALVKLKQRKHDQYRAEVQKAEEAFLDELSIFKGNPSSKEERE